MALQTSGPISLANVQTEFGGSNPISISEYYGVGQTVPSSGTISLSHFYGQAHGVDTYNTKDIFGDGSCISLWKGDNNTNSDGAYPISGTVVSHLATGRFGNYIDITPVHYQWKIPVEGHNNTGCAISVWVNFDLRDTMFVIYYADRVNLTARSFIIDPGTLNPGVPTAYCSSSTNPIEFTKTSGWMNFIVSVGNNYAALYVNGSFVGANWTGVFSEFNSLAYGNPNTTTMDQARLFNRAITSTEASQIYNEFIPY